MKNTVMTSKMYMCQDMVMPMFMLCRTHFSDMLPTPYENNDTGK